MVALAHHAIHDLIVGNDATERVEHRVEDQGLQRRLLVTLWMRHALYDGIEDLLNAHASACRCTDDAAALTANKLYDFIFHLIGHGTWHVALIDDWDDFKVVLQRHVEVGNGLSLNALTGIYNQ